MARPLGSWHETGLKTCTQCALEKPIEDFRANSKGSFTWCQDCHTNNGKKTMQEWRAKNPERATYNRKRHLLKQYSLTPEEFTYMVMEQGGVCAICNLVPSSLYVDHDHATGSVRGLLCQKCNSGIGFLGDDINGLEKALNYLKRNTPEEA